MNTGIKELTISISSSMELELDAARRERYREGTRNEMIADLIARGLASLRTGNEQPWKAH